MTLPQPEQPRKSRRLGLILPWLAALLLAAGWSGGWFWVKAQAIERMDAGVAAMRQSGYRVGWAAREVGGFPFRLDITLRDASVAEPSGWALAAPTLKAEAFIQAPGRWVAVAPAGVTLTRPRGGAVAVGARALRASLGGLDQRPPRLSVEGIDVTFTPAPGAEPYILRSAERLELHLRPGPDDQAGLLFKVEGARLALAGLPARVAQGRPAAVLWDLTLSRVSGFQGADWADAVRRWQGGGGAIMVRQAEIRAGEAVLTGAGGPLTVGPDGRLNGELTATLREAGGAGAPAVQGVISLKDGQASLGPLYIGPSPRLY